MDLRPDVRVIQRGRHFLFTFEPGNTVVVLGDRRGQDLERDLAFEAGIAGAEHFAHAAGAEGGHDLVGADPSAGCQRRSVVGL